MPDNRARMNALQNTIRSTIPMAQTMDFSITTLEPLRMVTRAPLAPNINIHGTAFAGALYTLGALTAWGMLQSRLPAGAVLVMMEGNIRYRRPLKAELMARCEVDDADMAAFLEGLDANGRSKLSVKVGIGDQGQPAAEFTGLMHASLTS